MPTEMKDLELLHDAFIGLLKSRNQSIEIDDNEDCIIVKVDFPGILFIEDGINPLDCSRYIPKRDENRALNNSPRLYDRWCQATGKEIEWFSYVYPSLFPILPDKKWARFVTTCRYDEDEHFEALKKDIMRRDTQDYVILKRGQIVILPDIEIIGLKNGLQVLFKIKNKKASGGKDKEQAKTVPKSTTLCRKQNKCGQNILKTSMSR